MDPLMLILLLIRWTLYSEASMDELRRRLPPLKTDEASFFVEE